MTPLLPTKRLTLRPLVTATQRQIEWLRDPKVVEFSEQRHRSHTLNSQLNWIRSRPEGSHLWAICRVIDNSHIGNLVAEADMPNQIADLSILIGDREYWGQGLATEAWIAACDWLLDKEAGRFRKLEAGCMAANIAMKRVLYHAGFDFEGERKNHFLYHGNPTGCVYYGKFR